MGTRHLISIYQDGEVKLAQYGQWDGYYGGQGDAIVSFLRAVDLDAFKGQVRKSRMLSREEVRDLWVAAGAEPDAQFVNMEVSKRFKEANPQLFRDSGSDTLAYIMEAEEPLLAPDSTAFAADSLFCEYAYVIDLDTMVFEVYLGFQEEPHEEGRFHGLPRDGDYYPVKIVAKFELADIPSRWISIAEGSPIEAVAAAGMKGIRAAGEEGGLN